MISLCSFFVLLLTCAAASGRLSRRSVRMRILDVLDEAPSQPNFVASMSLNLANFESSMSYDFEVPSTTDQHALIETSWTATDVSMSLNLANFEASMSYDFEVPSTTDQHALIGTSWTAIDIDIALLDGKIDKPITIEFDTGNHVLGSTGCNRYGGAVELSDGTITFGGRFQTTRRYCDGLMDQERNYLSFLKSASFFYDISKAGENGNDKDELILYTGGKILARFAKGVM